MYNATSQLDLTTLVLLRLLMDETFVVALYSPSTSCSFGRVHRLNEEVRGSIKCFPLRKRRL